MAANLVLRYTGGASNSDPDLSLGGVSSSVELSATAMNNLFDNVSPAERTAGDTEYRALTLVNNGDATAENIELYMSAETSNAGTALDFGLDSGVQTIVDEDTAPVDGVTFAHYTSVSKLAIPNITAAGEQRIWIRRVVQAGAANDAADTGTIAIEYA
jgi:hypothetical protein